MDEHHTPANEYFRGHNGGFTKVAGPRFPPLSVRALVSVDYTTVQYALRGAPSLIRKTDTPETVRFLPIYALST